MKSYFFQLTTNLLMLSAMSASAAVRYVNVNSPSRTPPFTNWTTAATNIQDAVNVAVAGDEIVVTNGTYATGARPAIGELNRVAVDKPLTERSVNGPEFTVILGDQASTIRCAYLTNGARLSGFTLTNGAGGTGGVFCELVTAVLSNCVLTGNSASSEGGGAYIGTLNNSTLTGNSALYGGGAADATLNNL
jgi:parallel beta-helix repeat protein